MSHIYKFSKEYYGIIISLLSIFFIVITIYFNYLNANDRLALDKNEFRINIIDSKIVKYEKDVEEIKQNIIQINTNIEWIKKQKEENK